MLVEQRSNLPVLLKACCDFFLLSQANETSFVDVSILFRFFVLVSQSQKSILLTNLHIDIFDGGFLKKTEIFE